jgi:hypothetical protein
MPLIQFTDGAVKSIDDGLDDTDLTDENREKRLLAWLLLALSQPSVPDAVAEP